MNATTDSPGHERKDADAPALFLIVLALLVSLALIFAVAAGLLRYFKFYQAAKTNAAADIPVARTAEFPQPRLEIQPGANLATLRAAEEADLNSYGWIDRSSGRVRIPIDQAMRLILERGLPDVGAGQTPLSLMQARPNESATPPQRLQQP
jgi:hypothetical protein